MANFYLDTPELKKHLQHPLMERIITLKEREFSEKDAYAYAPKDVQDAQDNYDRVLEIVGEVCGDIIAPNAEGVDNEKPVCANGRVSYASGTAQNLQACRQAGLMGMSMPRRLGGLNFPITPYIMAADMVSRSDAGFENLWGLQDCAETIYEFGSEEQKQKYITRVCEGETMSMDLTEPDAGSDLQAVMLKATYSEEDQCWYLNGVKRFITNGDSDIHLVLARSEEGSKDGRGLSMFIYDKRNGGVTVRRIENKMGIKGSPTCELVYKNAKAELCGSQRLGLIKYVMALMNGARLGIAAQSVGISEACYREAKAYAAERMQFGKTIDKMLPVSEMLNVIKAKLDANRCLLYETCRYVDMYKILEDISKERKLDPEERKEQKMYAKLADSFTPIAKGMGSEFANQNAYDCIQIHGGSGFMKDYACERIYRDARITSIYEGTTQLQVVAAIRYVTTGAYLKRILEFEEMLDTSVANCASDGYYCEFASDYNTEIERIVKMREHLEEATARVVETKNQEYLDLLSRELVEIAGHTIMSHLLLQSVKNIPEMRNSCHVYIRYAFGEVLKHYSRIMTTEVSDLHLYKLQKEEA